MTISSVALFMLPIIVAGLIASFAIGVARQNKRDRMQRIREAAERTEVKGIDIEKIVSAIEEETGIKRTPDPAARPQGQVIREDFKKPQLRDLPAPPPKPSPAPLRSSAPARFSTATNHREDDTHITHNTVVVPAPVIIPDLFDSRDDDNHRYNPDPSPSYYTPSDPSPSYDSGSSSSSSDSSSSSSSYDSGSSYDSSSSSSDSGGGSWD